MTTATATRPPAAPAPGARVLGALLVEAGDLDMAALDRALSAQRTSGERIGEVVVRLGLADEGAVARALARQLGLSHEPGPHEPEERALALVRPVFAKARRVLPLRLAGRVLVVAMENPLDLGTLDDLQFQSGKRVEAVVSTPSRIRQGLARAYDPKVSEIAREIPGRAEGGHAGGGGARSVGDAAEDEARAADSPVARLVDLLLRHAVEHGASDLHVEQGAEEVSVRERVDGVLRKVADLPPGARSAILSRIKVLAGMDISVKRRPQDGGFPLVHGAKRLSVRVSTLPVEGGEKAVLRLLDPAAAPADLAALGLSPEDLVRVRALLRGGRGVVLAAGPTGSGKSSTLFGALGEIDRAGVNVVTLEDPIEYRVAGVNQVQVSPLTGLTFPSALRAVLRQDPDVIMVGEIRDRETAEIAMAAAITGHLVLSTIHTIDAPSGITRLLQMGVPAHLVAGGLTGIVAQRLLRRSCRACGARPTGCPHCHQGYRGRIGAFQILTVTDGIRDAIAGGADTGEIRRRAEEAGMGTMADDARRKVAEGLTTPHEAARVLREDPGESLPCRRCGGAVPSGERGCPHCGMALLRTCVCGRIVRRGWRYCPSCLRRAGPIA